MKSSNGKTFDTIARQYKAMRKKYPDRHIDYCVQQKTLADAIEVAAKCLLLTVNIKSTAIKDVLDEKS